MRTTSKSIMLILATFLRPASELQSLKICTTSTFKCLCKPRSQSKLRFLALCASPPRSFVLRSSLGCLLVPLEAPCLLPILHGYCFFVTFQTCSYLKRESKPRARATSLCAMNILGLGTHNPVPWKHDHKLTHFPLAIACHGTPGVF